jgi:hypothetical protein
VQEKIELAVVSDPSWRVITVVILRNPERIILERVDGHSADMLGKVVSAELRTDSFHRGWKNHEFLRSYDFRDLNVNLDRSYRSP